MTNLDKHFIKFSVLATGVVFATQLRAHEVVESSMTLPVIAAGESKEISISCPGHHYALSGGFKNNHKAKARGPLSVTASYPKSTNT